MVLNEALSVFARQVLFKIPFSILLVSLKVLQSSQEKNRLPEISVAGSNHSLPDIPW